MEDLTLVGLTGDKSKLVLASDTGERFTVPVDDELRAAVRGELARFGQGENRMESALRPRDIQARIRAGESPQNVADAAQTTLDRIMTYATPVLAERAHIAERAQRASIRRRAGEGPARVLGEAVAEQLRSRNLDPESVDWDSWRREDGRWHVVASFGAERSSRAEFVFDVHGRYVVAEDDDARWLVGEPVTRAPEETPGSRPASTRPLSTVGGDEELPLGDDAIELVTGTEPGDEAGSEDATLDLTPAARELRRARQPLVDELAVTGDADWIATQATERPVAARAQGPDAAESPEPGEKPETERPASQPEERTVGQAQPAQEPSEQPEQPEQPEPAGKRTGRKGRRASVPSWDEIMFGGGRTD